MQKVVDDFMLKVDGELTRRQRLYTDTMREFQKLNTHIEENTAKVDRVRQI